MSRKGKISRNELSQSLLDEIFSNKGSGGGGSANVLSSFTKTIKNTEWSNINESGFYEITINHNLKSDDILVSAIDLDTHKNAMISYTIIDTNTISVECDEKINLKIVIINSNNDIVDVGSIGGSGGNISEFAIAKTSWEEKEKGIFSYTLNHNFNSKLLLLNALNSDYESVFISHKFIDNNNIEIKNTEAIDMKLYIFHNKINK